ncbi:energy-coupling factor transporter transmembrane component T family protein [Pseudonocardia acaciae]|uniref:energy-coupling factor transporter transmembrane component T family protein n=1 Tax=Pseudonocardia acaciae TaxID=551276 RepID=UPI00048D8E4B|nr:energy-coupling factor transporter transmembrane component T [Pseudonocardia acaciae]
MIKYLYLDGDSFYHRIDPRAKMLFTLAHFVACVVLIEQVWLVALLLVESVVITLLARAGRNLWRLRPLVIAIFVLGVLSWIFLGARVNHLWWIFYEENLGMGASAGIRSVIAVVISILLLSTTRNEELGAGLRRLGVPYGAVFAFTSALRMAPVLIGSSRSVMEAQRSRGLDLDSGNAVSRLRRSLPLLVPAFLLTMRSTSTFSMAIEAKGYGHNPRSRGSYLMLRMRAADLAWCAAALLLIAGSIVIGVHEWFGVFTNPS